MRYIQMTNASDHLMNLKVKKHKYIHVTKASEHLMNLMVKNHKYIHVTKASDHLMNLMVNNNRLYARDQCIRTSDVTKAVRPDRWGGIVIADDVSKMRNNDW